MPIPPIIPIHIYLYIYPYLYLHISHAASRDPIRSLVAICSHTLRTATCTHYYYNNRSIYKARDGVWQGGGSKCLGWDIHNGSIIMCNKLSKFVELLINFGATLPVEGKKNMKRNSLGRPLSATTPMSLKWANALRTCGKFLFLVFTFV